MKLYCVRHGQAEKLPDISGEQALTEEGQKEIQKIAHYLSLQRVHIAHLLHSGKLRAKQTADIISKAVMPSGYASEICTFLGTEQPVIPLVNMIQNWHDDTMLIGHMPFISKLVSFLVLGEDSHQIVRFLPGTVVCLEQYEDHRWIIDWMSRPELLQN